MNALRSIARASRTYGARGGLAMVGYYALRGLATVYGPGRECTVCGWRGREFAPMTALEHGSLRPRAQCPSCRSLERHRAYAMHYESLMGSQFGNCLPDVLHFAPDGCLEPTLRAVAGRYVKSSYECPAPDEISLDLQHLALPDGSYDAFVLNHVLCCVPDDRQAIAELHRALRPGGLVIAGERVFDDVTTREWPAPGYGGRWRDYGALDLAERFAPFDVSVMDAAAGLSHATRERYRVVSPEPMIVLRRAQRGD